MGTLSEVVDAMVAVVTQGLDPDGVEDGPQLVGHVGDVASFVGAIIAHEGEVGLLAHRLLGDNNLLLHVGLELEHKVDLVLVVEGVYLHVENFSQVPESLNFFSSDHKNLGIAVVELEELQKLSPSTPSS